MIAPIAVLCLAVGAQASSVQFPADVKTKIVQVPGKQYEAYKTLTDLISLSSNSQDDTFLGLDKVAPHDEITADDLKIFYWHPDLQFAVEKFMKFVDDHPSDNKIHKNELDDEFKEKAIKVALIECSYLVSPGLRQSCFADQLLTYAALDLSPEVVTKFLEHAGGKDEKISKEELDKIKTKSNADHATIGEELGLNYGPDGVVTKEEFTEYVTQEALSDDFRRCRHGPYKADGTAQIDYDCLADELVEYIHDDLTDMDIAVLFKALDKDGRNTICIEELEQGFGVDKAAADKIMTLIDMSLTSPQHSTRVIDFGEFRTYMRSPTVLMQAEKECTEELHTQAEELDCLWKLLHKLVTQDHDAIWLVVPDLAQVTAFEIIDKNNNGVITKDELNEPDAATKEKFIEEFDTRDEGKDVDMEEFNEYMDIPHMVYGTAACLLHPTSMAPEGRGTCFPKHIFKLMRNIKHIPDTFWKQWFEFYDTKKDELIDAQDENESPDKFGSKDLEGLFLLEMGQGDNTIILFEFKWYVKQNELAERYTEGPDVSKYHALLKHYIENDITEYDIEKFFAALDKKVDHELNKNDFTDWNKMQGLLVKIDGVEPNGDKDQFVNFREFWLWLNSPHGQDKKIKDIFETKCTEKHQGVGQQAEEIKCYVTEFNNPANFN